MTLPETWRASPGLPSLVSSCLMPASSCVSSPGLWASVEQLGGLCALPCRQALALDPYLEEDPCTLRDTHIDPNTRRRQPLSHSGPQTPYPPQGQPHVITPDTGVTPSDINACHLIQPSTLATLCRQPEALSPPGQVVTDRHPVTLADSHISGNWCTHDTPPTSVKGAVCAGLPGRPRGFRGWFYLQETRIFTMLYF